MARVQIVVQCFGTDRGNRLVVLVMAGPAT